MSVGYSSYWRSFLTGLVGFVFGGVVGSLAIYLIFLSGVLGWLVNLIPPEQNFIRLLAGLILVFLGIGLGGAIGGALSGISLHRIDQNSSQRRYGLGGAFALGISEGILLVPVLLILAIIGLYNNYSDTDPASFIVFFGIIGLVYGLLSGLVLSLVTVKLRYFWMILLAAMIGFGLGGMLFGALMWQVELFSVSDSLFIQAIVRLVLSSLAFSALAGGLIGMAYQWIAQKRLAVGNEAVNPRRWQDILIVTLSLLIFFVVASFIGQAANFLTVQTGTTTTELSSETNGVHWSDQELVSANVAKASDTGPGIFVGKDGLISISWMQEEEGATEVFYNQQFSSENIGVSWANPINVSSSPSVDSHTSQVVSDSSGAAHIVWVEESDDGAHILYSICRGDVCEAPVVLSNLASLSCAAGLASPVFNLSPTIAIDDGDTLMVTWDAEGKAMPYVSWGAGAGPPAVPDGCIPIPPQEGEHVIALQPRLTSEAQGIFWVTYVSPLPEDYGEIYVTPYYDGVWETSAEMVGQGSDPEIFADQEGQLYIAWCDPADLVAYQHMGGQADKIPFPACESRPGITQDADGNLHLVWYASEVKNVYGLTSPNSLIYESIITLDGWSEPAIVARVSNPAQPAVATQPDGSMHLAWQDVFDGRGELFYASQEHYDCSDTPLSDIEQAVLSVIEEGGYHPEGYQAPYCRNRFEDFIFMPNPEPAFSSQPPTINGGFDKVAAIIDFVQYEALFTTMEYIGSEDGYGPGTTIGEETAELYRRIKEDPSQYPKGLTVRIMLGNYPNISNLEWGNQIWNAINDLRDAGVEEMENPEIGWKVEVANFSGVYPHSHTKFLVLDGKILVSSGYNYGWLHFSKDHPSGKGDDLVDLGMILSGPVAQSGISTYDDMWVGANQLYCADFHPEDGSNWQDSCEWKNTEGGHVPEVLKYSLAEEDQVAFSLYRTDIYKEADDAYVAALSTAKQSIDAIHVNFSLELICMVNVLDPDICTIENALPWMEALVEAVEQNNVKVRAIVENANSNGLENRVAIQVLEDELASRGLEGLVEVRFFNGRVHTKSALIDSELLIVGSQNFHYSAFGEGGLLEYNAATDDPDAIETYQTMFDYYWEQAIPADEADWANSNQ